MGISQNSFGKGMNLDVPNYQYSADLLSYCRNCDFITGEGNEGILQNVKGNTRIDGLKENYYPVAVKEYGGIAYIVSAEVQNNTFTGRGEVGTFPSPDYNSFTIKDSRTLVGNIDYQNPKYSVLKNYFKETLNESDTALLNEDLILYGTNTSSYGDFNTSLFNFTEFTEFDIELQISYDDTMNIIFTDNINPIRLVNTRFTPLPNNIVEIRDRSGSKDTNLYTKLNFKNTLNLSQSSNKIVNIDLESISNGGKLQSGVYNYYIKYATQDGNTTNIIAESFSVSLFHGSALSDIRGGDPNVLRETTKLVQLKLQNLDTNFDSLVVQFSYSFGDENIQTVYYEIETKYKILSDSIIINHTGREPIFNISREELDLDYVSLYTCKTLTQVNNRLFLGNIKTKFYDQTIFESYANRIKIGHKQKKIEVPYTSAVVDDNSIYNSSVINKTLNSSSVLSIGYKDGYYNPYNVYYYLPYYPGERYAYAARFILDDGTVTNSFPLRGIDNWDNNKYSEYFNEVLNDSNGYFSLTNGENLKGLYRFPRRETSSNFAQRNNDFSYLILDDSNSVNRVINTIGNGIREDSVDIFTFTAPANNSDIQEVTLENYYLSIGGNDPNNPIYAFNDPLSIYSEQNCIDDPNCSINSLIADCSTDPNCIEESYEHDCEVITELVQTSPDPNDPFEEQVNRIDCGADQFFNASTVAILRYKNQLDEFNNPLGTTYTYSVGESKNAEANIFAVTFELPQDIEYPTGTIGVQFMRSVINDKDIISQGYLIDTLPVPSIDIFEKEESGNQYTDYTFFDGGMKLVPAIDYVLDSPAVWNRRGSGPNRRKERTGRSKELTGVKFNSVGWTKTKPYKVYQNFAFISNDLLCDPKYIASSLTGNNFDMFIHNKVSFYTSIKTNSAGNSNYFSLYKTIGTVGYSLSNSTITCTLDWVESDINSKTPNGFASRCLFTATTIESENDAFVMFPLKYNSYVGVNVKQNIILSTFSSDTNGNIAGVKLYDGNSTYQNNGLANLKDSALLVSLYNNYGFELGTNTNDLTRLRQGINLSNLAYTPITKRVYWVKNNEEPNSVSIEDISEAGKVIAYGGDNFVSIGFRQLYNSTLDPNIEAFDNEARDGRVGYSFTLVNDSLYNPLFRTINLNYFPNILNTNPNSIGNKYGAGNQWRDYKDLESISFNFGALKTYTDKSYITLVNSVPFLNTNFSTRVMYSELHINSAIENGYRNFLPSAYRDYSKELGAVTALRVLNNTNDFIFCIQENGTIRLPIADRTLLSQADMNINPSSGQLLFEESGILPPMDRTQVMSKLYGTKWLNSVVESNGAIYFVDIENTKVIQLSPNISLLSDYNIQSFLLKVKDTYSYKSVNLLNKDIYAYFHLRKNDVHFTFKDIVCSRTTTGPITQWSVEYTTLQEYNNGILTGIEKSNVPTDINYIPPVLFDQENSPCPFDETAVFPIDTDIYVIWDGFSFSNEVKANLKQTVIGPWIQNFRTTNPQWVGTFEQIDAAPTPDGERWLKWVEYITSSKAILICMIDEAQVKYHNPTLTSSSPELEIALTQINTTQPTPEYITDYNNFINLYNNIFDYFKGMIYAIPAGTASNALYANFHLHVYAAIEGETVSPTNFKLSNQGNITIIQVENLYSTLGLGLKNYGWQEQHTFIGNATDLTLAKFTADINPLILANSDIFTGWRPKLNSAVCTPISSIICTESIPVITQNISYNEPNKIWNSFWGFYPSAGFNLYNKHYTLNSITPSDYSSIWLHDSNQTRCNFYTTQDEFVFEFVVTSEIQFQKMFNNFILLCNEVPPIFIEYTTDNEPTIDDVGVNPTKEPRIQTIYPRFRGRYQSPYINQTNPILNSIIKYNTVYKENHMYIQIDDDRNDTRDGYVSDYTGYRTNKAIRDKYLKVRFRYKGDEYSIIQAVVTAYEISFS